MNDRFFSGITGLSNGFPVIELTHPPSLSSPIVSDFFIRRPVIKSDKLVSSVLTTMHDALAGFPYLQKNDWKSGGTDLTIEELLKKAKPAGGQTAQEALIEDGYSAIISEVSERINKSSLDINLRLILSYERIYTLAVSRAIYKEGIEDPEGIFNRVVKFVAADVRGYLNQEMVKLVVSGQKLDLGTDLNTILEDVLTQQVSFKDGNVLPQLTTLIEKYSADGVYYTLIDNFFAKSKPEINPAFATPEVRSRMVTYLKSIGLMPPDAASLSKRTVKYDEYLAMAYIQVLKTSSAHGDPLLNAFSGGGVDTFSYAVDYFESAQEQGIDAENILAAGTLYYIKTLADDLGLLRAADSVLMRWTSGQLDIPQGATATKLYRFYKLREDRTTEEERAMFYKMVLDAGNAEVLDSAAVNRDFPHLWDTLMQEIVKYIEKFETKEDAFDVVSKSAIYQAIKDLQYNLTVYCSGIVKAILPEMYKQLENAIAILDDEYVKQQLGRGLRRSLWNVVEHLSANDAQYVPNTSAMRTSAVNGHKIFTFIAHFDESNIHDQAFQEFVQQVESFIIAQSQLGQSDTPRLNGHQEDTEDEDIGDDDWDF